MSKSKGILTFVGCGATLRDCSMILTDRLLLCSQQHRSPLRTAYQLLTMQSESRIVKQ